MLAIVVTVKILNTLVIHADELRCPSLKMVPRDVGAVVPPHPMLGEPPALRYRRRRTRLALYPVGMYPDGL